MAYRHQRFMAAAEQAPRERSDSLAAFTLDEVEDVGKEIGSGSYGKVIELDFRGLKCAGKKLHHSLVRRNQPPRERQAIIQRFETECSILSHLRHPNIVQFLGVYYESNSTIPVLVMEFLPVNLTRCIEDYGILPNEVAYSILRDVALGLCYLHGFKPDPIVHRDLSANNVLLTADMTAKISDLGVARILNLTPSEMKKLTQTPGTPLYMPPEALRPHPLYTSGIDIYSFGILILHIFSGKWPIPSEATTPDPNDPDRVVAKTEVQRREEYFQVMGRNHPLAPLAARCLHNHYPFRPSAKDLLGEVRSKLMLMSPTLTNKVQAILWEKHLRSNIESLQASVAMLKKTPGGAEPFAGDEDRGRALTFPGRLALTPGPSFGRRLSRSFESVITTPGKDQTYTTTPKTNTRFMATTGVTATMRSDGSVCSGVSYTPEAGVYACPHPCEPGAKLVLTTDNCCDLPVAMYNSHAIVVENKVYVGGGCTKDREKDDTIFVYNVTDNFWSPLPPCPVTFFGLALIYDQIATVGGRTTNRGITNLVYAYDDDSKPEWKPLVPPMPTARHSLTVVSHSSNVFACGGRDAEGISKAVEVFIASDGQWFVTYPLPYPFYQMSSTIIHGTCYLLGGYDQFAFTDKVVYTSLSVLVEGATNRREQSAWKSLPSIRYNCATAANLGGCLLAIGGSRMLGGSRIDIFSQVKKAWLRLTDLTGRDAYFAPIIAELPSGRLLIIGGATSNLQPRTSMYLAKIVYH